LSADYIGPAGQRVTREAAHKAGYKTAADFSHTTKQGYYL